MKVEWTGLDFIKEEKLLFVLIFNIVYKSIVSTGSFLAYDFAIIIPSGILLGNVSSSTFTYCLELL